MCRKDYLLSVEIVTQPFDMVTTISHRMWIFSESEDNCSKFWSTVVMYTFSIPRDLREGLGLEVSFQHISNPWLRSVYSKCSQMNTKQTQLTVILQKNTWSYVFCTSYYTVGLYKILNITKYIIDRHPPQYDARNTY